MAARKVKIDLLLRKDFSQKSAGKLLLWALTVGRYIAIFTELVVIAGVIARFTLDYQRNRITEDILEQQALVDSYYSTELQIRRVHAQLSTVAQLEDKQLEVAETLEKLSAITPPDLRVDSMKYDQEALEIEGAVLSAQGLSTFLFGLQTLPAFDDIVLESVETGGPKDPSIHFVVVVELGGIVEQTPTQQQASESEL